MRLQDVKRREHTPVAKHSGPGMARAEPARDGGFCVFAKGVCSLKPAQRGDWADSRGRSSLLRKPGQIGKSLKPSLDARPTPSLAWDAFLF
ncbi:hypothetical protein CKF42_16015 [Pantoea sp. ARC270]|nr:hypothetical protein CKF42_16015 [Pantoea sp. ARC270]